MSSSDLHYVTPNPSTGPLFDKENEAETVKGLKQSSRRNTTGKSAQSGKGGIKAAAKRTKQRDTMLAKPNANKVAKRTGGVGDSPKRSYNKKTHQKVARVTRSSSKLTSQLSPDSKAYLSCKSPTLLLWLRNSLTWAMLDYDVLLTYEDVKSLKNDWLTDNVSPPSGGLLWPRTNTLNRTLHFGRSGSNARSFPNTHKHTSSSSGRA